MRTKVMVVDDSLMVRQQVSRALANAGFDVTEATDGVDALEKLRASPDFDLVVCDVHMPRMSGVELLQEMSEDATVAGTKVVMLTTEAQQEPIRRAMALGAKAWILKPFKAELLVAAVKKITAKAA